MDLTLAELADSIADATVESVISGLTLPVGMSVAEFLAKTLEGAALAARTKNTTNNAAVGSSNYIGSYPTPNRTIVTNATTGVASIRSTYGVIVQAPTSLDEATVVNS